MLSGRQRSKSETAIADDSDSNAGDAHSNAEVMLDRILHHSIILHRQRQELQTLGGLSARRSRVVASSFARQNSLSHFLSDAWRSRANTKAGSPIASNTVRRDSYRPLGRFRLPTGPLFVAPVKSRAACWFWNTTTRLCKPSMH
jgi:hypothetical protein